MDEEKPEYTPIAYDDVDIDVKESRPRALTPMSFIEQGIKQKTFNVKKYYGAVNTQWGPRAEWEIDDEYDSFRLSSWNLITDKGFSAKALVGKRIQLISLSNKKFQLKVLS